jgi:7,8-dihydropterin-6-yl-methyl-4-(beta-D-ribofuranosyl)aminobenzene 5'-phosphate synthase
MTEVAELDGLRLTVLAEDSVLYESPYLGQHGVSFFLEGKVAGRTGRILVDVGQNSQALFNNMRIMGVSAQAIDAIVLTHCHYDHTRGVVDMLRGIGKKDIPVIVHPSVFRANFVDDGCFRHVGIAPEDSKEKMEKAGGRLFLTDEPFVLMAGIITTGEVKRQTDFEFDRESGLKTIENGLVKDDAMLDDTSVVANVKGKGLVIVTGCSHAGIVNIAKHAMELTGCEKIEGIIGGLHLIEASDARINRTVEELAKLNISWICAGHCTGFKAQVELYLAFKEKFSPLHTGMEFEL